MEQTERTEQTEQTERTMFRKEAMKKITSPDQLNDYLRVTNPGTWVILAAVIVLLAGLFVWSGVGTLETTEDVKVKVQGHTAEVISAGTEVLQSGMPLRVSSQETVIASVEEDAYGRTVGTAEVQLPDGTYDGKAVVERTRPIEFLLEGR